MYSETRKIHAKPSIPVIALLTALCGFGCIMLGYLFLPLAAAFYASLLMHEERNGKILSFVIPIVVFILNVCFNGFYSVEGIAYVAVGLIIYFCYTKNRSKGEAAFWVTLAVCAFIFLSFVLIAFDSIGAVRWSAVGEYYSELYYSQKKLFVEFMTALKTVDSEGAAQFAYNASEAEALFNALLTLITPLLLVCAFALTGFSFKLFSGRMLKYSESKEKILSWSFGTSSFIAYFYVIVAIISIFASGSDAFAIVVSSLDTVLCVVYAYIGAKLIYAMIASHKGNGTAFILLFVSIVLLNSFAVRLLSYVGVYYTVISNNAKASAE